MSIYLGNNLLSGTPTGAIISKNSLTFTAADGYSINVHNQIRFEYNDRYEYYLSFTVSKNTATWPASDYQKKIGDISGLKGKALFTHIPISVWGEGGRSIEEAILYGTETSEENGIYVGGSPLTGDKMKRFYAHFIRLK